MNYASLSTTALRALVKQRATNNNSFKRLTRERVVEIAKLITEEPSDGTPRNDSNQ